MHRLASLLHSQAPVDGLRHLSVLLPCVKDFDHRQLLSSVFNHVSWSSVELSSGSGASKSLARIDLKFDRF